MKERSDSQKQEKRSLSRKCDFCDNMSSMFAFKLNRGTFKEFYICEECCDKVKISDYKPEVSDVEDMIKRIMSIPDTYNIGSMLQNDIDISETIDNERAERVDQESLNNECLCCGTTRQEIEDSGIFPCSHCFDSFSDLKDKFPDQFLINTKEMNYMLRVYELEERIDTLKDTEEFDELVVLKKELDDLKKNGP